MKITRFTRRGRPRLRDVYVKQSVFPSCMANGLPASEASVLAATQRPLTSIALPAALRPSGARLPP
jgi:hypothetical protein